MQIVRFAEGKANIEWQLQRGAQCWIAICDPLSLTVEAETISELTALIGHSMDDLFRDLLTAGELDAFLRTHGWTASRPLPERMPHEGLKFDVPFRLESGRRTRFLEGARLRSSVAAAARFRPLVGKRPNRSARARAGVIRFGVS